MAHKKKHQLESVGWLFWGIVFVASAGPAIYAAYRLTIESAPITVPISMGALLAAIAAAFISWGVNSALQARYHKRRLAERKQAKKK